MTMRVRDVEIRWHQYIVEGVVSAHQPDPLFHEPDGLAPLTIERAHLLVATIEDDFNKELERTQKKPTGYMEMPDSAQMAFAQELYGVIRTVAQICAEAEWRLAAHEKIPPF